MSGRGKPRGTAALFEIPKGHSKEVWVHQELEGRKSASCLFPLLFHNYAVFGKLPPFCFQDRSWGHSPIS